LEALLVACHTALCFMLPNISKFCTAYLEERVKGRFALFSAREYNFVQHFCDACICKLLCFSVAAWTRMDCVHNHEAAMHTATSYSEVP